MAKGLIGARSEKTSDRTNKMRIEHHAAYLLGCIGTLIM